ncbi:hypothetical protein [Acidovorax sp. BLS4]|uniref:hypothetical protein n=1 Tax=Acidovorax sp. BLS4 TaxID=3273430 RepID=UPI0029422E99|nr:hypothetical protein [Paracidovorax avenae]WOI45634.1 hypothetical protein R1Z03_00010 [Paracidovorax avenae]
MNLIPFIQRLSAAVVAKDKTEFQEVCFDLEYTQLECEFWSQEVFDFFANALQDKATCSVTGSSSLVMSLYNDFNKLTKPQIANLIAIFDENAEDYGDEILRHSVSDMVARKYPAETAMKLFKKWRQSTSSECLHMAQVGLEILIMTGRLDSNTEKSARLLLGSTR